MSQLGEEQHYKLFRIIYFAGDQCPMFFDDGSNPWGISEHHIQIFNWDFVRSAAVTTVDVLRLSYLVVFTCVLTLI